MATINSCLTRKTVASYLIDLSRDEELFRQMCQLRNRITELLISG